MRRALTGCCLLVTMVASTDGTAATPSPGCAGTLASGTYRMTDQQVTRTYRLFVPSRYAPGNAYPLVVVFHGWGGDESEFLGDAQVTTLADERGYIVVAPRGLGSAAPDSNPNSWSFRGSTTGLAGKLAGGPAGGTAATNAHPASRGGASNAAASSAAISSAAICDPSRTPDFTYPSCKHIARNTCSWTQCQADDVAFTLALVKEIESKLCVDPARVFASGGSNGGMFTWELGQNPASAPTFRAIAALIGLPHRGYLDPPGQTGAIPVLLITGSQDRTVPPGPWESAKYTTTTDGSAYYYTGASAIVRRWGTADHCRYRGSPAVAFNTGIAQSECRTYCGNDPRGWSGGPAGARWPNVLDCRAAMGHTYDFGWSWKLTLDFFDAHSR